MKKTDYILIFCLVIILAIFAFNNIQNPNVWYDEAVQFFIAKGIFPFARFFVKPELSFFGLIIANHSYNADPGLFSMLLSPFTFLGDSAVYLRLLPYLFFLGALGFFTAIVYELTNSKRMSLTSGLLFFLLPSSQLILDYAFEIRPFSMEICGIFACFYLLLKTSKNLNNQNLLFLGLASAFFIGSRYSFWVYAFVLFMCVYVYIFKNSPKTFIKKGYWFYAPVLISIILYLLISLRFQISFIKTFDYYYSYIFGYNKPLVKLTFLKLNFLSWAALPTTLFLIIFQFLKQKPLQIRILYFVSVLYEFTFMMLSLKGLHPWYISVRWSIGLSAISLLCFAGLLSLVYNKIKYYKFTNNPVFSLLLISIIASSGIFFMKDRKFVEKTSLLTSFKNLEKTENFYQYKFLIPNKVWPEVKYLFEHGALKESRYKEIYPSNFLVIFPKSSIKERIYNLKTSNVMVFTSFLEPHLKMHALSVDFLLNRKKYKAFDSNILFKGDLNKRVP